ncbi:putative carbohydrate esterase family 5 protein [Neofusicoccum parvum]|uniref:Carbohydrate esterase family 5 protein n=1 Tax=Neofusicoccum parvum TaxID=310453 RepID=A0ACB5S8Z8_9PEZI|nr:putative carbohydrate esterase family 5 protein [Neofusicoccum parvum]
MLATTHLLTLLGLGGLTAAFPMDTPVFVDAVNPNIVVRQVSCAPIHLIIARASTEPPGPGMIGSLAEKIIAANPGATNESISYPATLDDYQDSSAQGTAAMTKQLTDYATACPCAQIVLMGYSQVFAAIQMGDPRFVANKSFDAGNSTSDGLFPRPANLTCDSYASRIKSYCDEGDTYCASGNDTYIHITYLDRYTTNALDFVNDKLA